MNPFEEIYHLNQLMKAAQKTLENTDLEFFGKELLKELNETSNNLASISFQLLTAIEKE